MINLTAKLPSLCLSDRSFTRFILVPDVLKVKKLSTSAVFMIIAGDEPGDKFQVRGLTLACEVEKTEQKKKRHKCI